MDVDALRSENSVLLPLKQYTNYAQGLEEIYSGVVNQEWWKGCALCQTREETNTFAQSS